MPHITHKLLTLLLLSLAATATFAERVLIDDSRQRVALSHELDCYRPVDIRIEAARPELYESDLQPLQRLTDAVRAMLHYECPEISEINILGMLRGLPEPVYRGRLSRRDDWQVHTLPLPAPGTLSTVLNTSTVPSVRHGGSAALALAEMHLGMPLEQVNEMILDRFGAQPDYDENSGIMTLRADDCPPSHTPEMDMATARAGQKCLQARFSDRRIPELEYLEIVQLSRSDVETVYQLLLERFGPPSRKLFQVQQDAAELAWTSDTGHTLEARLHTLNGDLVRTGLKLFRAGGSLARAPEETVDLLL